MTTETAANAASVAKEIGTVVAKEAALTAAEVGGAVAILAAIGFAAKKLQDRKAKKPVLKAV